MLDTPCSEVVWRVLATHSIRQFSLHFPSRASPCAITFQLESTCRYSSGNHWYVLVFCPKHKHSQHTRCLAMQCISKSNWLSIPSYTSITWLPTLLIALHYVVPLRDSTSSLRRQHLYLVGLQFVVLRLFLFSGRSYCLLLFLLFFLGALTKLRIATVSFVMSVRLSAWNSAPPRRIFMKIWYLCFFNTQISKLILVVF